MKKKTCFFLCYLSIYLLPAFGKTFPSDLFGNFTDFDGSNPQKCPNYITQTTFTEGPVPDSWKMPHNTILHEKSLCNSFSDERKVVYFSHSLVPNQVPDEVNLMLGDHGPNIEINYPLNDNAVNDGEDYYIGYEEVTRFCQDGSKFNNGTLYFLFRPFLPVHMPLASKEITFYPEWKYLIAVPRYSKDICIYRAFVPGAESEELVKSPLVDELDVLPTPANIINEFDVPSTETFVSGIPEEVLPSDVPEAILKPACFPAKATVELNDGRIKYMKDLVIGDIVRTGKNSFSKIFMFTHREFHSVNKFIRAETSKGYFLELSHGHFIYANSKVIPAQHLKQGDYIETLEGVDEILSLHEVSARGLFNPQTFDGDIVVNRIRALTYTSAFEPQTAHASLSLFRAVFKWIGLTTNLVQRASNSATTFYCSKLIHY